MRITTELSRHLRLTLGLATASIFAVAMLFLMTRFAPLTDKHTALVAVMAFAAAGLCVVALLSAGVALISSRSLKQRK